MRSFVSKEEILKGWSGDKKYCVQEENGKRYLLRVCDPAQYERKRSEFEKMQQVAALGVPMCLPLEFGVCEEGVYSLQSWIDGVDAEEVMSTYSGEQQYAYGLEAGRILKKIHSIPAPEDQEDWALRFNRKMDYKIQKYGECPIHYENGQAFLDYIAENRHLLNGRPQVYQHGDYHIGNMMIDRTGKLCVIDFNRNDYGDPWEEFNRIVWCAQAAPIFASGMVDGYFDGQVPMDFWKLLALYISSNTLSSVYWAIPFGEKEVETMLNQAKEVLSWYDNMKNPVPTWYVKGALREVIHHYDCLIDEGNDPVCDPEPLREYMDKWDGPDFIRQMQLDKSKTVLEIGVGTGRLAMRVAPLCGAFFGVDLSPKTVQRATEHLSGFPNVRLVCGDFLNVVFQERFDVVYSSLTFLHIADKEGAIRKVSGLLKDEGRFFLSIDKNQSSCIDYGSRTVDTYPDTRETILSCMEKAGMTVTGQYETELATVFIAQKRKINR